MPVTAVRSARIWSMSGSFSRRSASVSSSEKPPPVVMTGPTSPSTAPDRPRRSKPLTSTPQIRYRERPHPRNQGLHPHSEAMGARADLWLAQALSRCWLRGSLTVRRDVMGAEFSGWCSGFGGLVGGAGGLVPAREADGHLGSVAGGTHQVAAGPEVR